ncbi:MAG: PTS sugar transporter subunit IIA [Rickettsiales bacterium]
MNIASLLSVNAIIPDLHARDKKQVLKQLAASAAKFCDIPEKEIYSILLQRENMGCTGMGNGVCIPHGRFDNIDKIFLLFARLHKPIDFMAADGKKVDLVFLLLTPSNVDSEHLKTLALISRLLRDRDLCATLRATSDRDELHALLTASY